MSVKRWLNGLKSKEANEYAELRFSGVISAIVLALMFAEWWLIPLGIVFYLISVLSECGKRSLVCTAVLVPIVAVAVFVTRIVFYDEFVLAALLYFGISLYLLADTLLYYREINNN